MKILVAEDEAVSRAVLGATLRRFGHDVIMVPDGAAGWQVVQSPESPSIAILDWEMPGLTGVELCRMIRRRTGPSYLYIILVTARRSKEDVVLGLRAGADDFVSKPYDGAELQARLHTGERIVQLEQTLDDKIQELETSLTHVRQLQGLLPICMHCKRIRDDSETWHRLESYVESHSLAKFSHSLCAECLTKHYPEAAGAA